MRLLHLLVLLSIVLIPTAIAQSLSPKEIAAQIDSNLNERNEFQELLSDPDPRRSREAMKIMMASNDDDLSRIALDFGLSSTDRVIQRMALEGFFNNAAFLQLTFDGSTVDDEKGYRYDLNALNGSVDDKKLGFTSLRMGEWHEDSQCWLWAESSNCAIKLSDAGSSIHLRKSWYPLTLNGGKLTGVSYMPATKTPVPFFIPVVK